MNNQDIENKIEDLQEQINDIIKNQLLQWEVIERDLYERKSIYNI